MSTPRFEIYNKDLTMFRDNEKMRVFAVSRAPDSRPENERLSGEDPELEALVAVIVLMLNRVPAEAVQRTDMLLSLKALSAIKQMFEKFYETKVFDRLDAAIEDPAEREQVKAVLQTTFTTLRNTMKELQSLTA